MAAAFPSMWHVFCDKFCLLSSAPSFSYRSPSIFRSIPPLNMYTKFNLKLCEHRKSSSRLSEHQEAIVCRSTMHFSVGTASWKHNDDVWTKSFLRNACLDAIHLKLCFWPHGCSMIYSHSWSFILIDSSERPAVVLLSISGSLPLWLSLCPCSAPSIHSQMDRLSWCSPTVTFDLEVLWLVQRSRGWLPIGEKVIPSGSIGPTSIHHCHHSFCWHHY